MEKRKETEIITTNIGHGETVDTPSLSQQVFRLNFAFLHPPPGIPCRVYTVTAAHAIQCNYAMSEARPIIILIYIRIPSRELPVTKRGLLGFK